MANLLSRIKALESGTADVKEQRASLDDLLWSIQNIGTEESAAIWRRLGFCYVDLVHAHQTGVWRFSAKPEPQRKARTNGR